MKNIYTLSIAVIASAMCMLTACSKAEIDEVASHPLDGSARVALNFNVKSSVDVTTRAAQSQYYEYLVNNIYILIFNGNTRITLADDPSDPNGNVNYFSPEEIKNYINKADEDGNTQSSGTIEFGAISGAGLKICAVANLGVSNSMTRADFDEDALTKDLAKFDAIDTYAEFKAMELELRTHTVTRGASFIMTGEKNDVTLQAYTGNPSEITEITIPLSRTDSKITFNVTADNVNDYEDFQFIPLKWRVVNVPAVSYVLPHIETGNASTTLTSNLDATNDAVDADYFSMTESEAVQFEGKVDNQKNSGTFTFYMYENLKAPASEISGNDASSYALREKQAKTATTSGVTGQRFVNGDYVYAPKRATYVILTGQISYTQKDANGNDTFVMADVEYSIHLGHGSETNVNSYNTLRNHHYTYNVKVTGINDLIVEVQSNNPESGEPGDEERRPGAEGDVVMSSSKIVEIDGHYDRSLITFTKEEASKLLFAVSTPWERGLDTNGFLEANNTTMRDYKWVKFLVNSEAGVDDNLFAAYPGEQCYDGGRTVQGTAANSTVYGKQVTLRDIRQLSNYFAAQAADGKLDDEIAVTMFIDEYVYYYDPTTDPMTNPSATTYKGVTDSGAKLLLWKKSVNHDVRLMHIVKAGDMIYSADGDTSLSRSVVTIKQKPILSIYNTSANDNVLWSAWGTETVNETPRLTVSRNSYPTQSTGYANIYANARNINITAGNNTNNRLQWANVISATEQYGLGADYTDPSFACAMRNRDLDGNGAIDPNEILWYLAAVDQISDLWLADPIMRADEKLYDPNNPDGYYSETVGGRTVQTPATHYTSSTILDNSPRIYWAEEFGATSTHQESINYGKPATYNGKNVVSVRCLRNLGIAYGKTDMPQDYIVVEQPTKGVVTESEITDEVLADGVANASEYDRSEEVDVTAQVIADGVVNTNEYESLKENQDVTNIVTADGVYSEIEQQLFTRTEQQVNNRPNNLPSTSGMSNGETKENVYGKVYRISRNNYQYYVYTYTGTKYYRYTYYRINDTSIDGSITLPYINLGALRSAYDNGNSLPYAHIDDIGENNRPYKGLFVSATTVNATWRQAYDSERSTTNKICPKGYRVPNQREIILMTRAINAENWDTGAYVMLNGQVLDRTASNFGIFYYYLEKNNNNQFVLTTNRISRHLSTLPDGQEVSDGSNPQSGFTAKVRCVKDNPAAKHSSSSDFNEGGEG